MKYVYQFGKSSNAIIALALLFLLLVLGAEYGLGISIDMAHMIKPALQVVLGVFILLVILSLISINAVEKWHQNFKEHQSATLYRDMSEQNINPPNQLKNRIQELDALGLQYFGVLDISLAQDGSQLLWYWTDPSYIIRAYVTVKPPFNRVVSGFISILDDETVIETVYRVNLHITSETLINRNITSSLDDAYAYHQYQLATQSLDHGDAIVVSTVPELIDYSERLRRQNHDVIYAYQKDHCYRYLKFCGINVLTFASVVVFAPYFNLMYLFPILMLILGLTFSLLELGLAYTDFDPNKMTRKKKKNS